MSRLEGRIAVVTGAASDIGLATSKPSRGRERTWRPGVGEQHVGPPLRPKVEPKPEDQK
jgi:hypothetical protein